MGLLKAAARRSTSFSCSRPGLTPHGESFQQTSLRYATQLQAWHHMNVISTLDTGGPGGTARVSRHPAASLAEHSHHHVGHPRLCGGCDPHDAKGLHSYYSSVLRRRGRFCLSPSARLELRRKAD